MARDSEDLLVSVVVRGDLRHWVVVPPTHASGIERELTLLSEAIQLIDRPLAFGDVHAVGAIAPTLGEVEDRLLVGRFADPNQASLHRRPRRRCRTRQVSQPREPGMREPSLE